MPAVVPGRNQGLHRSSPLETYRRTSEDAHALATQRGLRHTRALMERAQRELEQRLQRTITKGAGADSFTAEKIQTTLAQVRAVLAELAPGIGKVTATAAQAAAEQAATAAVSYIRDADTRYTGIAQRLAIKEGALLDRTLGETHGSILNRLQSDPEKGKGIIERYGDAVLLKFEDALQQRFMQGKSWEEARNDLIAQSPFLQDAPMYWAERILRTEVMAAHNTANLQTMHNVEQSGGAGGMLKILSATFDNRTSADSYAVHGQIRRLSEPFNDWYHAYQQPPNRPNDREVVVPHNMAWPIPEALAWKSDAEVSARWHEEGRKGSPPPRPKMTTVPLKDIGVEAKQSAETIPTRSQPTAVEKDAPAPAVVKATPATKRAKATRELDVVGKTVFELSGTTPDSMRAESMNFLRKGGTPKQQFPITFTHYPDVGMKLTDGRHRITVAREQGQTHVDAVLRTVGPKGGLKKTERVRVKVAETPKLQPIKFAPPPKPPKLKALPARAPEEQLPTVGVERKEQRKAERAKERKQQELEARLRRSVQIAKEAAERALAARKTAAELEVKLERSRAERRRLEAKAAERKQRAEEAERARELLKQNNARVSAAKRSLTKTKKR